MFTIVFALVSCGSVKETYVSKDTHFKEGYSIDVSPEDFTLKVTYNGVTENISDPLDKMEVRDFKEDKNSISWIYDDKDIEVSIIDKKEYIDVTIKSLLNEENNFSFPKISGDKYVMPIGGGKLIDSKDNVFKNYFETLQRIRGLEGLSMQFFAVMHDNYSLVYVIKNPYNNTLEFDTEDTIKFTFNHEFPRINENKEYGFRIYVTDNDIIDISKIYREYVIETGGFKTLKDKEKENPNVSKLYGAPHVYFWNDRVISKDDINWKKFKNEFPKDLEDHVKDLLLNHVEEGKELSLIFDEMRSEEDYVSDYVKNGVVNALSEALKLREFYDEKIFGNKNKSLDGLNDREIIDFNKELLRDKLGDLISKDFGESVTTDVIKEMKSSGIHNLLINFEDHRESYINKEFVDLSKEYGYLVGTYDSYHSIHKKGEEEWITATFSDESLYEEATVTNKNGEKIEGFNGVGRKLNPVFALDSVKERVEDILNNVDSFNSWFLDTDGTGEVFDDYTKGREKTEEDDIKGRIKRINYLAKDKNMVVGTEGGNDFVNKYVSYAHGIDMAPFQWMDPDLKDKSSEYYLGAYYSPTGGVAKMFSQKVPLKDYFREIFLSDKYNIPLYKLVYNDSVITTYWWGNGTLKFKGEEGTRMIYEVLYNIPPLYHIDADTFKEDKDAIVNHYKVWSEISKKVINKEMTGFKTLKDGVQMTEYEDIKIIGNFNDSYYDYEGEAIDGKSLLIIDGDKKIHYIPQV